MCANFPITCRAASSSSSSSFSAHRLRHRLLLLIVLIGLSMVVDVAHGMGCVSSRDQASLPHINSGDKGWNRCLGFCSGFNNNRSGCYSYDSVQYIGGKQCRCKRSQLKEANCVPHTMDEEAEPDLWDLPISGY
ncbi:hypothetical protein niasHS_002056 [Heterodera schachtii]|uniref:Uncharacterized protein n=1 Tax=Heterodera schachtii TaxID=97005 RepID=A0ABD2K5Q1_HETSC